MSDHANGKYWDSPWNWGRGCTHISPGCANCWAETFGGRYCKPGDPWHGFVEIGQTGKARWTGKLEVVEDMLTAPLRMRKPTLFFTDCFDPFHEFFRDEQIHRALAVVALCPHHSFLWLTKRADRMRRELTSACSTAWIGCLARYMTPEWITLPKQGLFPTIPANWPLPNLYLGVSVEDQATADERIEHLRNIPAKHRWISQEPQLEDITYRSLDGIEQVVVGGESGLNARPFHLEWAWNANERCRMNGASFYFKQAGSNPWYCGSPINLSGKGHKMSEWPKHFRVREWFGKDVTR